MTDADGYGGLHDGDGDGVYHREPGDADDRVGNASGHHHGTALSGTQLNATGSVAGTLAYSPVSGTVLSAGSTRRCR